VPGWGCAARGDQAGGVFGLRPRMHATASAGGDHGFKRGSLRGLLQLWAVYFGGRAGKDSCQLSVISCQERWMEARLVGLDSFRNSEGHPSAAKAENSGRTIYGTTKVVPFQG